jgi:hypothetical protein
MKKIILPGLIAGVAMLGAGMAISFLFTEWQTTLKSEYENTQIFRAYSDPVMSLYFLHPFTLGITLAWLWDKAKVIFQGKTAPTSVFYFALAYSILSLSGMLISYATFQVSVTMVLSWVSGSFVEAILGAFIFSKMNPA